MTGRRLIVGSAATTNSFGVICSVRDHWGGSVFVVAIYNRRPELVAASVLADRCVQVPIAGTPDFLSSLQRLAESYPDSWYLPLDDAEIELAACLAAEGKLPAGLKLIAPPYRVVRLCNDRWAMHEWLRSHGLPSPQTSLATAAAIANTRWPALLMPRYAAGSLGARLIRDPSEIAKTDSDAWLLRPPLDGPEITVDAFVSRGPTGKFCCACRELLSGRAGTEIVRPKMRVFNDAALAGQAQLIAQSLPIAGSFSFQVAGHESARRITAVMPRVDAHVRISAAVGLDFAAAGLADFWGEPTEGMLKPLARAHYVVREYTEYLTGGPRMGHDALKQPG